MKFAKYIQHYKNEMTSDFEVRIQGENCSTVNLPLVVPQPLFKISSPHLAPNRSNLDMKFDLTTLKISGDMLNGGGFHYVNAV